MFMPGITYCVCVPGGMVYAYVAFSVCSRVAVDSLTAGLRRDGYEVTGGPRVTGDGYYESSIVGVEGNRIEITA